MSQVVGLPNNSYKPITNTAWVRARFCKLQKGCTPLAAGSDKVYQLLAQGQWFSSGTLAFSTTKTGFHDIAEILLKVGLIHQKSKSNHRKNATHIYELFTIRNTKSYIWQITKRSCTFNRFGTKYMFGGGRFRLCLSLQLNT